ncbi:hypothetical protein ANN_22200 [Periplaneta americana]|uniref:Per a allergen n=1 Tax=Periplaneta americana TaxID=6978 RepID=A0ABQ8S888_PERAM|nr:hypothetical protein ANN_22200 [Periplaneta americana]
MYREDLRTTVVGIATTRLKLLQTSWDPVRKAKVCETLDTTKMSGAEKNNSLRHQDSNPGFQLYVLTFCPLSHTGFQFRCRIESAQFKIHLYGGAEKKVELILRGFIPASKLGFGVV